MTTEKKIKIAFLGNVSPEDRKVWSGTIFRMYDALLKQGFEIEWIKTGAYSAAEEKIFEATEKIHKKIFNRGFNKNHFFAKALAASRRLSKLLKKSSADVVFAPTTVPELAFLRTDKPILYLNDATFHQLLNYYGGMSGFGALSKKTTVILERLALRRADALVFSSDWAANHARDFYGIPAAKIHTVKFGSNAGAPEQINLDKNYAGEIIFLFLAVDWERKGGQIALDAVRILRKRGWLAKLQVVGCIPPVEDADAMRVIPFLNKNNPEDAARIISFLSGSHFTFIPTRADCTPISFCEAASYGLPVISTDTGGVTAHVEKGRTGLLLPHDATPEQYADEIEKLLIHPEKIREMSQLARDKYEQELNWEVWGEKMKKLFSELVK